jgi:hypothetical protein
MRRYMANSRTISQQFMATMRAIHLYAPGGSLRHIVADYLSNSQRVLVVKQTGHTEVRMNHPVIVRLQEGVNPVDTAENTYQIEGRTYSNISGFSRLYYTLIQLNVKLDPTDRIILQYGLATIELTGTLRNSFLAAYDSILSAFSSEAYNKHLFNAQLLAKMLTLLFVMVDQKCKHDSTGLSKSLQKFTGMIEQTGSIPSFEKEIAYPLQAFLASALLSIIAGVAMRMSPKLASTYFLKLSAGFLGIAAISGAASIRRYQDGFWRFNSARDLGTNLREFNRQLR